MYSASALLYSTSLHCSIYCDVCTLRTISSRHSIAGIISTERCQLNRACSDGGILRTVPIDAFDAIQNIAGSSDLTLALTIMRGGDANVRQGGKAQVEEMGSLLYFVTGLIETCFAGAPFGAEIEGSSYDSSAYPKAMVNIDVSAINVVDMNLCQDHVDFMTAEGYNDVADWLIAEDKANEESFKFWRRQRRTYGPCSQSSHGAVDFVTDFIPWLFTHYISLSDDIIRDTGQIINNAHVILVLALLVLPGIKPRELWSVCWHCYQQQLSTKRLRNYLRQHLAIPACFLTIVAFCVVYLCYVSNLPEIFILVRIPLALPLAHWMYGFVSRSACERLLAGKHFRVLACARNPRISNWNYGCACLHDLVEGTAASNTGSRCWDCHKRYPWMEG